MEQSIQLMLGIFFFILGLSYIFRSSDWSVWLDSLRKEARNASFTLGLVNLLVGGFIVSFHWRWEGIAMLVTIIGCMAVFKGFVYLICPGWLPKKLDWIMPKAKCLLQGSGLVVGLIGSALLYAFYTSLNI